MSILVHRLVAYQKFGDEIFVKDKVVRHLDGNSLNNSDNNIAMGTNCENQRDIPKNVRNSRAINAANKIRRFTDEMIKKLRKEYNSLRSYKKIMESWNISSKGSLHYMLNNNYVTTKI